MLAGNAGSQSCFVALAAVSPSFNPMPPRSSPLPFRQSPKYPPTAVAALESCLPAMAPIQTSESSSLQFIVNPTTTQSLSISPALALLQPTMPPARCLSPPIFNVLESTVHFSIVPPAFKPTMPPTYCLPVMFASLRVTFSIVPPPSRYPNRP